MEVQSTILISIGKGKQEKKIQNNESTNLVRLVVQYAALHAALACERFPIHAKRGSALPHCSTDSVNAAVAAAAATASVAAAAAAAAPTIDATTAVRLLLLLLLLLS